MARGRKAKGKKGRPKAANTVLQPSTCNGTAHQNGQEKPAKKAKLEKSYPKAANKDPQPSTINGTAQQNGQEIAKQNQKEEIDKCVNRLLEIFPKIEPRILYTKAEKFGGNDDKVTDWIHNVYYKDLADDFPKVSTSPNEPKNEEKNSKEKFEPAPDESDLNESLQKGILLSFGENVTVKFMFTKTATKIYEIFTRRFDTYYIMSNRR